MTPGHRSKLVSDGDAVRRWRENRNQPDRLVTIVVIIIAILLQLVAMLFYIMRYRRCDSLTGFLGFMLVIGLAGFLVSVWVAPAPWTEEPPRIRRCRREEPHA